MTRLRTCCWSTVALVVIAGAGAWLVVSAHDPPPVAIEPANALTPPAQAPVPQVANAAAAASQAEVVRTAAAAATPLAPSPRRGWRLGRAGAPLPQLPATLPVVVVDLRGEPAVGASVSVFGPPAAGRRPTGPARQQSTTDAAGRTQVTIAGECLLSAERTGVDWSGDVHLQPGRSRLPDLLRLVLLPTATVRGRVLLANGTPAAGARVYGSCSHGLDELTGTLSPLLADADGRFTTRVRAGVACFFEAQFGAQQSEPHIENPLAAGEVREITWSFPGGYSVRGVVLDAGNAPVQASVRLRDAGNAADLGFLRATQCDRDGRFEVLLSRAGRYQVLAGIPGQTAAGAELTLDAAEPHAQATLVLRPFAVVEGRVVDERARPCGGVQVQLEATSQAVPDPLLLGMAMSLQGNALATVTDAAGGFRFAAPAGCRYRIRVQPVADNRWLSVHSAEFAAPASGLAVVVGDADRQGFLLGGTVVAAATGAPVTDVRVGWCSGGATSTTVGTGSDGTFRVGPFATGRRYTFEVEAIGFAPALVGPFDATTRREQVTVRVQRWATLRCRVLRADGTPAPYAFARLEPGKGAVASARTWQDETDATGCVTFHNVVPDRYRVLARATRHSPDGAAIETVAAPGETSEVQVSLVR